MPKMMTIKEGMKRDLIESVNQMIEKLFEKSPLYKEINNYIDYEKNRKQLFLYLREYCNEVLAKIEADNQPKESKPEQKR